MSTDTTGRTSATATAEAKVIDIDLRERYEDLLSFGSFTEVQRAFATSLGFMESDLTRVLVIDDTRDLEAHADALSLIVKAPGVQQVICLAVGPPLDDVGRGLGRLVADSAVDPNRVALHKPFELASHVMLWVGDARGIGWGMGQHRAQAIATGSSPAQGPVLDALFDALLTPKVFDRVYEVVRSMPEGVASPGLRAMIGQVDDDVLADARVRAIDRILAPRRHGDEEQPDGGLVTDPFRLLLRYPRAREAGNPILARDGGMDHVARGFRGQLKEAVNAHAVITGPGPVLQNLRAGGKAALSPAGLLTARVMQVGHDLGRLRDELSRMFTEYDSVHPLGTTDLLELGRRGFALAPPEGTQRVDLLASLRHLVTGALDSRRPVTEITGWLSWMHGMLVPVGSAARLDDLGRACDTDRLQYLRDMPRRLDVNLLSVLAILPVLVCGLLAAAAPDSARSSALAGAGAALFVAVRGWPLVVARRMTPLANHRMSDWIFLAVLALFIGSGATALLAVGAQEPATLAQAAAALGLLAVAGLVGWWFLLGKEATQVDRSPVDLAALVIIALGAGCVGQVLGTADSLDPVLSLPVRIVAGALAFVGLMWWPYLVWSRAVRRWHPGEYITLARAMSEGTIALMEDVARYDWSLTGPRRAGADLVRAMSLAFEDVTSALTGYSDRLRGFPARPPRSREAGVDTDVSLRLRSMGAAISDVVEADVVDLIASVIDRCWPDIEREALDALGERVVSETRYGLDRYNRHLERMGVHATPPFRADDTDRRELVDAAWQQSDRLGVLLRADVADSGLMQLCAPEHLQLLDVDARSAAVVRFAPRAAQPSLVARGPGTGAGGGWGFDPLPSAVLGELEWPEWGQVAGVLRLVRMRPGTVETVLKGGR
ncbi:hypothetical protein MXD62_37980 [Frankia sp. Mgl5]|uniref:hypothetical protein n=1 Tax=Frankia sp. Mgl5 TaxID=2933793 RepID=UPI00200F9BB4|nr:hypothetical protein [Frankia sp. Mgl5]MCK9932866.1 hypothetical protein [Frankia sp. Mgl5]